MIRLGVTPPPNRIDLPGSCRAPSLRTRSTAGFSCCLAAWRTSSGSCVAHRERIPRFPASGTRAAIPAPSDANPCEGVSGYGSGEKEAKQVGRKGLRGLEGQQIGLVAHFLERFIGNS